MKRTCKGTQNITSNNTSAITDHSGNASVILHGTEVFRKVDSMVTLNHGGYVTATTAKRINEACAEFAPDLRVYRKGGTMYLYREVGEDYPIPRNGLTIDTDTEPLRVAVRKVQASLSA
jgi:hypothetical protein